MVFGPVQDALRAKREGRNVLQIMSESNKLVNARLPLWTKVTFWLTNAPYFLLSARLLHEPRPHHSVGEPALHAVALAVVAMVSTAFHGSMLFGSASYLVGSRWPPRLLAADLLAANSYGALLATRVGFWRVVRLFSIPLILLLASARLKRRGFVVAYAAGHGAWHLLSAAAMWRCLYFVVSVSSPTSI
jgi:hypothetical protein